MKRLIFLLASCLSLTATAQRALDVVPYPQYAQKGDKVLTLRPSEMSCYIGLKGKEKKILSEQIAANGFSLRTIGKADDAAVRYTIDNLDPQFESPEAYRMEIGAKGIDISAAGTAGLFYAHQTLQQLAKKQGENYILPFCRIYDAPRFGWRGWHADVSRHFFDKEYLKKQLRMMAHYKINRFHWHLTDDPGWRIEIKKYPQLTQKTAYRPQHKWTDWGAAGMQFCDVKKGLPEGAYGGYYTQKDIREIVDYAAKLHITVVPEIEMPGHSWEVLAAMPELGCSGKPYQNGELCIGNEATFEFLENVLTEVLALFPSEYIHIGGDEANRSHWANCPKCQKRMQDENLKSVEELQSYLTRRIENFLNAHGRKLLGWDEIIEGGLSPRATVMSWRGEQGGIEAARTGHDAVMTPWQCYLDNAQDDPQVEPRGVGGYVPLEKTYAYDPVPAELTPSEAKHILGVQGNVWAEHIPTAEHAEYMIYPRILAIAEDGWSLPENKNWQHFHSLALQQVDWLRAMGYNTFNLAAEKGDRKEARTRIRHLASGCPVIYTDKYSHKYTAGGDSALTDGVRGSFMYQDKRWQGVETKNFEVTIDLGKLKEIHGVKACFMQRNDQWIWLPKEVVVSISDDGTNFREVSRKTHTISPDIPDIIYREMGWKGTAECRYVRLTAVANGRQGGWIFTDEVIVE